MRPLLAVLLLVLQLQPVLGAAVCLGLVQQPTQASCEMPDHGSAPFHHYSESMPESPQNCAIASFCGPAPLAIPGFADLLETTLVPTATLPISGHGRPPDVYTARPFHPPKA